MDKSTIEKFENLVIELDEKICDERRRVKNKSFNGSVFALNQWVKEREFYMKILRGALRFC